FSLQNIEANLVHQSSEVGISSFTQVGIINRAISELDGVLTSQLLPRVEATLKSLSLHDLSGESAAGERDLLVLNVRKATEALRAQVQGIWDVDQAREHYDSSLLEFLWSRLESDSSMI
ncbi:MAG: hypothetical protein KDD42_08600, partial [Bdellovibrionales bacterium]|nr:hypothetical protein [Bdellovibrionales bacterium]